MNAPGRRGALALDVAACTSCLLCVRECPDHCIEIDAHKETVSAGGARPRTALVLDRLAVDYGLCMYCGICVEVCPFDALSWVEQTAPAAPGRQSLVQAWP